MPAKLEYGVLVYDVPLTQRSLYNRLRKKIRHYGIPMTMSVYLIPWGARPEVQAILDGIENEKPGVISSSIIKFDAAEEKKLAKAAEDGLQAIIRNAKELMMKRLEKAETEQRRIMDQLEINEKSKSVDPKTMEQAKAEVGNQYLHDHKKAVRHAENALGQARRLALAFNLSDQLEYGFAALEELVRHKWELIGVNPSKIEEEEEVEA